MGSFKEKLNSKIMLRSSLLIIGVLIVVIGLLMVGIDLPPEILIILFTLHSLVIYLYLYIQTTFLKPMLGLVIFVVTIFIAILLVYSLLGPDLIDLSITEIVGVPALAILVAILPLTIVNILNYKKKLNSTSKASVAFSLVILPFSVFLGWLIFVA